MSSAVHNQFLYLNSKNRHSGDPWDFDIVIDPGLIQANKNEEIRLSLVQLSMPLTFNQVNPVNNNIIFTNKTTNSTTSITIPDGNWNVYDLAAYIRNTYHEISSLTFSRHTNHFIFTFSQPHQISFNDETNLLFGFENTLTQIGTTIESDLPSKPTSIDDIIMCVYGVTNLSHNLDNVVTPTITPSPMLGMIPIDDIPFGNLRYINDNGEYSIRISEKAIKRLRFVMTNTEGRILDFCNLPDFTFVIKIMYVDNNNESIKLLREIKDYNHLSFLSTNLRT